MAQIKVNLLRNMMTERLPAPPDHDREVLIVRACWVVLAVQLAVSGASLWPGFASGAFLFLGACALVTAAGLRFDTPLRFARR